MKTNKVVLIIAILTFSVQAFSQLTYTNNGMLGIRRTPSYNLDVEGTARFSNWTDVILDWTNPWSGPVLYPESNWQLMLGKNGQEINTLDCYQVFYDNGLYKDSDKRLKNNIKNFSTSDSALSKLRKIQGISYNYNPYAKSSIIPKNVEDNISRLQYGYIAQDFKNIFPNLVIQTDDSTGLYAIDYVGLIPVITEAIKEQQDQISTLQNIVYSQEKEIIWLKEELEQLSKKGTKLKSTTTNSDIIEQNETSLFQNTPNPFTIDTEIKYFLANNISNARLIIHDMQGLEIMSYLISERGNGSKIIKASELKAGMYLYTLIADGQIIDCKRMILTSE